MNDVFNYTHPTGHVFSPSERVALATSVPLLATTIMKKNLFLWGKIFGYKNDYIILKSFGDDLVSEEPELFYSVDEGLTFTLLGTVSSLLQEIAKQDANHATTAPFLNMNNPLDVTEKKIYMLKEMQGSFMGDPAYEYRIAVNPADETNQSAARKSLKESVRVALFVEEHDYHCRVAPRGAYFRQERNVVDGSGAGEGATGGEIHQNSAFQGLKKDNGDAVSLRSYYHIRRLNPYRKFLSSSENTSGALYFISGSHEKNAFEKLAENQKIDAHFESLGADVPSGLWRLKYDSMSNLVSGSHAYFPGSLFFHVPETGIYGSIYMGDGIIDNDVAFEI